MHAFRGTAQQWSLRAHVHVHQSHIHTRMQALSAVWTLHPTHFQQHLHSSSIHKQHGWTVNDDGVVLVHMAVFADVGLPLLRKAVKLLLGLQVVLGTQHTEQHNIGLGTTTEDAIWSVEFRQTLIKKLQCVFWVWVIVALNWVAFHYTRETAVLAPTHRQTGRQTQVPMHPAHMHMEACNSHIPHVCWCRSMSDSDCFSLIPCLHSVRQWNLITTHAIRTHTHAHRRTHAYCMYSTHTHSEIAVSCFLYCKNKTERGWLQHIHCK